MRVTTTCSTQWGRSGVGWGGAGRAGGVWPRLHFSGGPHFPPQTHRSYLTLCDMCSGVSISSKMAPFTLEPRRFASCRSQPERSQFCRDRGDARDISEVLVIHRHRHAMSESTEIFFFNNYATCAAVGSCSCCLHRKCVSVYGGQGSEVMRALSLIPRSLALCCYTT